MADTQRATSAGDTERDTRRDTNPRRELVREELLDIAARMFDEQGFDRVSMTMIAREVGLGRSALYHYFTSKDDILASLVEAEAHAPVGTIQSIARNPELSASDRLLGVVREGVVRRLSFGSRFLRLGRLEAQIPENLRATYDASRRAIYAEYLHVIKEGIANGEFRQTDPQVAAFGIIGMATWTSRWFREGGRLSAEEVADLISEQALMSIRRPAGHDESQRQLQSSLGEVVADLNAIIASVAPRPVRDA
ncbi:TetR/AcrR family transcriptional regulator [Oceanicola sp. S124]|uniref:TetR/AcrR family transcriptional regulator n=1 Tax=Oceanicola sp. S124 TaxID=1042378 RepID=UPI0002557D3E|nr:TetR/AcrR family transcriptional regulator [Oceanicola sp. S124]